MITIYWCGMLAEWLRGRCDGDVVVLWCGDGASYHHHHNHPLDLHSTITPQTHKYIIATMPHYTQHHNAPATTSLDNHLHMYEYMVLSDRIR